MTGIAPLPVLLLPAMVSVVLAAFAFWIWILIHVAPNHGLNDGELRACVLIFAFVQLLGALIYFFVGRPKDSAVAPAPIS